MSGFNYNIKNKETSKMEEAGFSVFSIILFIIVLIILIGAALLLMQPTPIKEPITQLVVQTGSSSVGTIITGVNGMSLYIFKADTNGQSTCYDACAGFWPPLIVNEGVTPIGAGVNATLGVTRRNDGKYQVTANNMPLYYYAGDIVTGNINGQGSVGSGALWWVLTPLGQEITNIP